MQNKAEFVFEKLSFEGTRLGAKILADGARKHLIKSYVKHQGKAPIVVDIKNHFVDAVLGVLKGPEASSQSALKNMVKETKSNFKNFFKK